ncbi:MAG: glucoamylase family protein [Chitinophagaceae bacterium]
MSVIRNTFLLLLSASLLQQCSKKTTPDPVSEIPPAINITGKTINGQSVSSINYSIGIAPTIKLSFSAPLARNLVASSIGFKSAAGTSVPYTISYEKNDSTLVLQPSSSLTYLTRYSIGVATTLRSVAGGGLIGVDSIHFITKIDSSRKFTTITDNALLDLVQQQTFKYFWDFGHPVSGLARERNTSADIVTSGGSGFGIMAIVTGVNRNFITRTQGLARMQTIVAFLKNTAQTFHGAYPHWLNGATGLVVPFSTKDNGADLVETSYLVQGLLCARQYFNDAGAAETTLRTDINTICNKVEWSWFRQNSQNVLYWHWSPNFNWEMNVQIKGWNECLITYVLAASSTTFAVPPVVYTSGWAGGSGFINGSTYFGYQLPLGPPQGGPLFFSHYSFLGINPNGLSDAYANYATQTKNHTLINYNYSKQNPKGYFGYSDSVWGLTASDIPNGYAASSPTNDLGVIAPTAALSSFPYTPAESMAALKFYYYVLGDKLWKQYGFVDAFSLKDPWFADSFLAIDEGPIIVMIENYRSGLLWNLFTSCPEIKAGMTGLGFAAPYL